MNTDNDLVTKAELNYRTIAIIAFVILVALAIIGAILLSIVNSPIYDKYVTFIGTILGLVTLGFSTIYALGRVQKNVAEVRTETSTKLDVVQRQTNGTLTSLVNRNHELSDMLRETGNENAQLRAMLGMPPKEGTN